MSLTRRVADRLDFGEAIDDIFFMGAALIIIARAGRVGVWNAATKSWQVRGRGAMSTARLPARVS